MRVLLVTQYFYPETFKSNDIAFELVKRGYEVDALVGIPNYPEGQFFKGYGIFLKRHENINGVNVYRCFQTPRGKKASAIGLTLNYLTFVISATLWVLIFFAWRKKYDAIITHEPSPITQIVPAIILGKLKKVPVYSWILDIWPDSFVTKAGKMATILTPFISAITEYVYRNSSLILVSSKGMIPLVNRKNDYSDKLVYFPNWCDDILLMSKKEVEAVFKGFVIMMAGSLNVGIGVDDNIRLVEELSDLEEVTFVFVGGGTKEDYMREAFKKRGVRNVVMTGRLPFSLMPAFYDKADAMLLTLKETPLPHLRATVPARMQSYMAAGKPILAMIDGCGNDIINEADCGYAVSAGDYHALAVYIRDVVIKNPSRFKEKGFKSRTFFEKFYLKEKCISNLEHYIMGLDINNPPYATPSV